MSKSIIYLRTSTKDQNPELQRNEGVEFASKMGLDVLEIVSEQGSAYKIEKVRPKWESVVERSKKEKLDIIIWKYDRCFRNRKDFFDFMKVMFEVYGTKVYSVTEPSIITFWNLIDKFKPTGNPVFDEFLKGMFRVMWDFMVQLMGEEAEEESRKKSERVKLAVVKGDITKSYKGNKWGRKSLHTNKIKVLQDIVDQNLSYRQISEKSGVSIGTISNLFRSKKLNKNTMGKIEINPDLNPVKELTNY